MIWSPQFFLQIPFYYLAVSNTFGTLVIVSRGDLTDTKEFVHQYSWLIFKVSVNVAIIANVAAIATTAATIVAAIAKTTVKLDWIIKVNSSFEADAIRV